jgi:hypothetical protein
VGASSGSSEGTRGWGLGVREEKSRKIQIPKLRKRDGGFDRIGSHAKIVSTYMGATYKR